jgi:hypothetical protein
MDYKKNFVGENQRSIHATFVFLSTALCDKVCQWLDTALCDKVCQWLDTALCDKVCQWLDTTLCDKVCQWLDTTLCDKVCQWLVMRSTVHTIFCIDMVVVVYGV